MNKHILADTISTRLAAFTLRSARYFRLSIDSPSYRQHLLSIDLELPPLRGAGRYEVSARSLAGAMDPAVHIARWYGPGYPTIIYHHGNNERPFAYGPST